MARAGEKRSQCARLPIRPPFAHRSRAAPRHVATENEVHPHPVVTIASFALAYRLPKNPPPCRSQSAPTPSALCLRSPPNQPPEQSGSRREQKSPPTSQKDCCPNQYSSCPENGPRQKMARCVCR